MTEQVYFDLSDGIVDLPPDTFSGIDADELLDFMVAQVPEGVEPNTSSLRGLVKQMRTKRPSAEMRASSWLSPRLIELIDHQCDLEELEDT